MDKRPRGRPPHDDLLTPAEWRIAHAVRHGLANRDIANRLDVSTDAVKFHVTNILGKLGLERRAELRTWVGWPKDHAPATAIEDRIVMPETAPEGTRIGQIARTVADISAAETWYRDTLGLPHLYTFGSLAFFDCAGTRLMLSAEPANPPQQSILYFEVPDIHARQAELEGKGVTFIAAPHLIHRHADGTEEWMGFFNDNEGRPLALMSRSRPPLAE